MNALYHSELSGLRLINRGKVRDIYEVDDDHLLIVTTDRLSAFDVVLPQPIPGKGEVLTRVANFWFGRTRGIIPNHLSDRPLSEVVSDEAERQRLGDRAVVAKRLKPLAGRGDRARLPYRLGLEGLPGQRPRLRYPAADRAAHGRQAARAALHPVDQGRTGRPR